MFGTAPLLLLLDAILPATFSCGASSSLFSGLLGYLVSTGRISTCFLEQVVNLGFESTQVRLEHCGRLFALGQLLQRLVCLSVRLKVYISIPDKPLIRRCEAVLRLRLCPTCCRVPRGL